MTDSDWIFVVARDVVDYERYIRQTDRDPRKCRWVRGPADLLGVDKDAKIHFTDLASTMRHFELIRAQVQQIKGEPPTVTAVLPAPTEGNRVLIDGTLYVVTDWFRDGEGCLQVTFSQEGSECYERWHRAAVQAAEEPKPKPIKVNPSACKCAYRAPELGPHPLCPQHGTGAGA